MNGVFSAEAARALTEAARRKRDDQRLARENSRKRELAAWVEENFPKKFEEVLDIIRKAAEEGCGYVTLKVLPSAFSEALFNKIATELSVSGFLVDDTGVKNLYDKAIRVEW